MHDKTIDPRIRQNGCDNDNGNGNDNDNGSEDSSESD